MPPGETPLDPTFLDTRIAFGVDWEMPLDRLARIVWGVNGSGEHDYLSLGLRAELIMQAVDNAGVPAGEETPDLDAVIVQANYSFLW